MSAFVNDSRAVSVRFLFPWRGAWIADVDLDPEDAKAPPSGAVMLKVGDAQLSGTVDPRYSGRFASSVKVRVVGGGGGWDKPVSPQHFHNDGGVTSTAVYQSTAREVGEQVNDPTPLSLGVDVARSAGAAARVFADRDWFVDVAGVTQVASRPAVTADKTLEVLSFDPQSQRLEVSCSALVLPGTTFTDARFDGTLTARDVEQTFDTSGSRATVWCASAAAGRLLSALTSMVRELGGATYLRIYKYRFISSTGTRLNLQAVDTAPGLPDLLPIPVWPGMAGLSAELKPSQTVLVAFPEGDKTQPIVIGFDGELPKSVTVDATDAVNLGGDGGAPVARVGDAVTTFFPPAIPFTGTIAGAPIVGVMTIVTPAPGIIQAGSSKVKAVT